MTKKTNTEAEGGPKSTTAMKKKTKKKNLTRLGGTGLSLEAFANAKSTSNRYNPALIKKQKEYYKNAKYVSKFKKKLKQQQPHRNDVSSSPMKVENETGEEGKVVRKDKMKQKDSSYGLGELYEKRRAEQEKARIEREAILKAKKEEQEKAEARRKVARENMFKKTHSGQPVMKYRIEHLLQSIQGSKSN